MILMKRTIYGSTLQTGKTARSDGVLTLIQPNSTLNQKFDVLAEAPMGVSDVPDVGYFCIGRGGHKNVSGADGAALTQPVLHSARDAALYEHLPFVLRRKDDDLTPEERNKYALRTEVVYGGVEYYAYWLKRAILVNDQPVVEMTVTNDGQPVTTPFTPSLSDLNPTPPEVPNGEATPASGEVLSVSSTIDINFDANDVVELKKVCDIIYGNELYATISEIGLCSGVDVNFPYTPDSGAPYNLLEAKAVQINTHVACMYPLAYNKDGFRLLLDLGTSEPLTV